MRVALEIAGVEGVKEAVRAGMGVGFVSAMSIRHEDGALHRLQVAPGTGAAVFHTGAACGYTVAGGFAVP
jgi:DNA-binding transcriptional LysR family regulator